MPAALAFPIGSRVLRLEVRERARAAHERPPRLPRARQGARRLEQHQRHDLPAGQPARLRAVGLGPRHGDVGLRALPPLLQAHGTTASRPTATDPFRGHAGPLVLERGPATNPLFGAFFEAVQQAGYPLTDDVNGYRQEGFAPFDRNDPPWAAALGGPRVPAPGDVAAEPRRRDARVRHEGRCSTARARSGSSTRRAATARRSARWPARSCSAAARSTRPQLLQLSGVGQRRASSSALGIDVVARPARRGRAPAGPPRGLRAVRVHAARLDRARHEDVAPAVHRRAVAVPAVGARRDEPLRGRRVRAQQRRRGLPEPDVPLPADRDPLRRVGALGRPRLPGAHRADVLRRARVRSSSTSTDPRVHPALRFNYLSTDQDRREWVEAIRVARNILTPAGVRSVQRRRDLTGAERRDRRGDPRLGREGRRDRPAPLVHGAHGRRRHVGASTRSR